MKKKNCDLLVVNNPLEEGAAFDHDTNTVTIYSVAGDPVQSGLRSKREVASLILDTAHTQDAFKKIHV